MALQLGKSIFYLEITFIYIDFSPFQDVWVSVSSLTQLPELRGGNYKVN